MIRRIVLIKLIDAHANEAGRAEVASRSREVLPTVPGVRAVAVGLPADERARKDWDLCIEVHFDRLEDVQPYIAHPIHRELVDAFMRPRLEVIKAWSFEA